MAEALEHRENLSGGPGQRAACLRVILQVVLSRRVEPGAAFYVIGNLLGAGRLRRRIFYRTVLKIEIRQSSVFNCFSASAL